LIKWVAVSFLLELGQYGLCTDFARNCTPFHASFCVQMPVVTGWPERQSKKYLILLKVLVGAQGIEPWTSPV
jgi:hypothetical protein